MIRSIIGAWERRATPQKLIGEFISSSNYCHRQKRAATSCDSAQRNGGVQKRQAETYLQRAREIIKADYSAERSDFLGTRLALLDEIIEASIRCKQHSNAAGALKLQAQLTRLPKGS